MPQPYSTVVVYDSTLEPAATLLAADKQFNLVQDDLWLREANIHILTNDAKYGKVNNQPATVTAGDILVFEDFNLADLYFINATATSDTLIYVIGITMSKARLMELGVLQSA